MSKLARYAQKLFGSSAGSNQMAQYGSFAAGAPLRYTGSSITPDIVQALSNYLTGWKGAVVGNNSPMLEDQNSIDYLFSYQLAYLFQAGIPEWNSATPYYIGSFASDGVGGIYLSITGSGGSPNTNNALSNPVSVNWVKVAGPKTVTSQSGAYTILPNDGLIEATGGFTLTMPDATKVSGVEYIISKVDSGTTTTIAFVGGQTAAGASTLTLPEQYGFYRLMSNGTNFVIVGAG